MAKKDETELSYTEETLEAAPARVTRFLQAVGAVPTIRTLLANAGMRDAHIAEGRKLLLACIAEPRPMSIETDTPEAKTQRDAAIELDAWDEPNFLRFGAAIKRASASAHAFVFRDLGASKGVDAVRGVATFLARVDALENGSDPGRAGAKQDDAKVVALLEQRGLTKAERKRLDKLVQTALGPTSTLDALAPEDDSARLAKLSDLRDWFDDWTATARAVVKKRAYLIRLGLAERKAPTKGEPTPEE